MVHLCGDTLRGRKDENWIWADDLTAAAVAGKVESAQSRQCTHTHTHTYVKRETVASKNLTTVLQRSRH